MKRLLAPILLTLGCKYKSCELSQGCPVDKRARRKLSPGCTTGQMPQLVATTTLSFVFAEGPQTEAPQGLSALTLKAGAPSALRGTLSRAQPQSLPSLPSASPDHAVHPKTGSGEL